MCFVAKACTGKIYCYTPNVNGMTYLSLCLYISIHTYKHSNIHTHVRDIIYFLCLGKRWMIFKQVIIKIIQNVRAMCQELFKAALNETIIVSYKINLFE